MAYITGVGDTAFGRLEYSTPLTLMAQAANAALADAGIGRQAIDGLLCGYATTLPHLMLSTARQRSTGVAGSGLACSARLMAACLRPRHRQGRLKL